MKLKNKLILIQENWLALDKMLQKTRGQLTVNTVKLSETNDKIQYEQDKLEEMEKNPQYTDDMKEKVKKRIQDLKIEKQARLRTISQQQRSIKIANLTNKRDCFKSIRF